MDIEYLSRHKERYFRKAEKYIRRAGLEEVLQVNRDTIGLYRNQAKVYIRPPLKKDTKEKMWKLALDMDGLSRNSVSEEIRRDTGVLSRIFPVPYKKNRKYQKSYLNT